MSKATPKIFISYRRTDSAGYTGRLVDKLQTAFGKDSIFIDILTIAPGADFRKTIERAINASDVLLAVIGKNWLLKETTDEAVDWVRVEIATALKRDVLVLPVLVQGATMPVESELPADLKDLAYRNALDFSDKHWDYEVNELIAFLKRTVSNAKKISLPTGADIKILLQNGHWQKDGEGLKSPSI